MSDTAVPTVAELDALPNLSVVLDSYEDVFQKRGGLWCSYETTELTSKQVWKYAPLVLLHTSEGA